MKKRYLLLVIPIFFFGFMYYINTSDEKEKLSNPKIGDLYVFDKFLQKQGLIGENVFKVSSISEDSISFFIPIVNFPLAAGIDNDIIYRVRRLDENNEMFSAQEITLSKKDIIQFKENGSFKNRIKNRKATILVRIY